MYCFTIEEEDSLQSLRESRGYIDESLFSIWGRLTLIGALLGVVANLLLSEIVSKSYTLEFICILSPGKDNNFKIEKHIHIISNALFACKN